ncbi:hypothetical protein HMPREF1544_10709 [Mucor circinelloides 1006PhL]|uniref:Kinesin motor domain-containing protein n=1 Tax=Mucor circinelloides f. circinelloides (strain 1006PhL) TaxID=1220926 RepID=S2J305_MUCC1|nr:hypothetical protein HMPREF1544_10709 [Mucor circinelloides 1006PhL]
MFKNLATVHTDKIKTFVHLHKVKLNMLELHPHDHSACLSIKDPNNIQAADHTKRMQWTMDACCSDPNTLAEERETQMLADLVLQGHDAAAMYIELGGTYATFKLKQQQKKAILDTLANALDTSNTTIEYVLFGFTDTYCYDLGRNTVCSSGTLIEKGIDHWMRRVDSMDDIWHLVSKGSKLPNVLKISIFNTFTKRNGSLFIFDLLEPQFIELSSSKLILCYKFNRLNKYSTGFLIRTIAKTTSHEAHGEPVITDYYFLTHTLSKFVCSQGQLVVFAHLNECLKYKKRESFLLLDLLESMRGIKVVSLANSASAVTESNFNHKIDEYKKRLQNARNEIKEKKSTITHCEATCQQLQGIINEKESQQRELEMNYEQNRKDELNKMRAQEYLRRDKMIDKHRSTIKKIQDLTMSTLAELKKKMDKVSNERDYWKQKLKEEEEKMKRLQMKERRFAGIWKTKEFDLLREINMLRSEREEFIKMFQTLQASLIAKNVDLDK